MAIPSFSVEKRAKDGICGGEGVFFFFETWLTSVKKVRERERERTRSIMHTFHEYTQTTVKTAKSSRDA